MKRRDFLRQTFAAGLAATAGSLAADPRAGRTARAEAAAPPAAPKNGRTKILLIGSKPDHPPGTHLYLRECDLLARCLRQTPGVEAAVSDGWPRQPSALEGLSALVLYSSPGAELIFRPDHAAEAEALLRRGVGLTALHWATGIADAKNEKLAARYLAQLGGLFGFGWSSLDISAATVRQVEPKFPVCRGWSDFEVKDEWYLNLRFQPKANPVAKVRVKGKEQVVAWTYQREDSSGGRSYGNTLGHFHQNFGLTPLRKAMVNGILWTAGLDIPAAGAPCAISAADMKL